MNVHCNQEFILGAFKLIHIPPIQKRLCNEYITHLNCNSHCPLPQGGRYRRHNLSDESIEVDEGRSLDIEVPATDLVDGFVVHHETAVRVLKRGVGGQD